MVRSFRDRDTEKLFHRERPRRLPASVRRTALRKLAVLNAATDLADLRVPPGNRLEKLAGDREGQCSIRINDQWRSASSGGTVTRTMSRSRTTTKARATMPGKLPPVHPGEVLLEEFLLPLGISQYRLAKDTGVPPRRINEIVHGKRAITADTALRLSRFFGTSEPFWLNLQTQYDLEVAKDRLGSRLEQDVLVYETAR